MKRTRKNLETRAGAPAAVAKADPAPAAVQPAAHRWVFRLMALVLPVLGLCAVEVFLRMAGYGYPPAFFLRGKVNGRESWIENQKFGWRFFPPAIARTPEPMVLPIPKPPGTCRLFIFGESAAQGDPEPSFGFWRFLKVLLEGRFAGCQFEVVNVAMTAISSPVIREIARDCTDKEGDLWVVLMGNNEVVGPFGAGTVFGAQAPNQAFVRGSIALQATRTGQLLASWRRRTTEPASWEGMEMFLDQVIRRDDPRMSVVYDHFQKNLRDILRLGQRSGARVVVSTVPCNLKDCAPFASLPRRPFSPAQTAEWDKLRQEAKVLRTAGQTAAALAKYQAAAALDGEQAELVFEKAHCELTLGLTNEARLDFELARDLDALRFRSDGRINEIIRQTAHATTGVACLDAVELFARNAPLGLPGEDLFYEHVHFRPEGNYLLARGFLEALIPLLPEPVRQKDSGAAHTLSLEDCARRLALTDWDRLNVTDQVLHRLKGEAPFTLQANQAERCRKLEAQVAEAKRASERHLKQAREEYEAALRRAPEDWMLHANFATLLEAAGDLPAATAQWREVTQRVPHCFRAWYSLSELSTRAGHPEGAGELLQTALRLNPNSPEVLNELGLLRANEGRPQEAIACFARALQVRPRFTEAEVNWGQTLAGLGQTNEAKAHYEAVLRRDTNSAAAHINLGKLLGAEGQSEAAIFHYQEAVRLKPDNAVARFNLGNALVRARRFPEALTQYGEAVRLQPTFPEARQALGLELERAERPEEALAHFQELTRLQPGSPDAHLNLGVALARQRRYREAISAFNSVLRLQPGHPVAQKYLEQVGALIRQ